MFLIAISETTVGLACFIVQPDKNKGFDWLISGQSKATLDRQKSVLDREIEGVLQ